MRGRKDQVVESESKEDYSDWDGGKSVPVDKDSERAWTALSLV